MNSITCLLSKFLPNPRYYIAPNCVIYERVRNSYRVIFLPNDHPGRYDNWEQWFDWDVRYDPPQSLGGLKEISINKYKMLIGLQDRK
jgi:hypothetical protein